jgi:hypothetical protein
MLVAGKPALKGTPISKNVFRGKDRKFFGNMQGGGWEYGGGRDAPEKPALFRMVG